MTKRCSWYAALAMVAAMLSPGPGARAQQPSSAPAANGPGSLGLANAMYGNSPLSPYLNPYAMQMAPGNPDFLTYMYLNNQRNGGIGSGVISGTRPAAGTASTAGGQGNGAPNPGPSTASRNAPYTSRPAVEQNRVTFPMDRASIPGANTGGYFQRGPNATQGAARYYSRMNPARNNGR